MAKKKDYKDMTDNELVEARIQLDEQIQALRAEKKAIQDVVDARLKAANPVSEGTTLSDVGGIESEEQLGNIGG